MWIAADKYGRLPRAKKVIGEIKGSERGGKLYPFVFANPEIFGASQQASSSGGVLWLTVILPRGGNPKFRRSRPSWGYCSRTGVRG